MALPILGAVGTWAAIGFTTAEIAYRSYGKSPLELLNPDNKRQRPVAVTLTVYALAIAILCTPYLSGALTGSKAFMWAVRIACFTAASLCGGFNSAIHDPSLATKKA